MKILKNILKTLTLIFLTLAANSCIHVEFKGAGVFKEPVKYEGRWYTAYINVPPGLYGEYADSVRKNNDGSKLGLGYMGKCGAQLSFTGIMIPVIPFFLPNFCKSKGFEVASAAALEVGGINLQLHYNSTTYDPYIDNGSVKFKIENFSEFKKAPDKTLIIHKKKKDGTIFTKELPFDWKIVVETIGGV